mgnify:CR=1 FL=1
MHTIRVTFDCLVVPTGGEEYLNLNVPRIPIKGETIEFPLFIGQKEGTGGTKTNEFEVNYVGFVYDINNLYLYTEVIVFYRK